MAKAEYKVNGRFTGTRLALKVGTALVKFFTNKTTEMDILCMLDCCLVHEVVSDL